MKAKLQIFVILAGIVTCLGTACERNQVSIHPNPPLPPDTSGYLKAEAQFPVGVGVDADLLLNTNIYSTIVKQQFDQVTPEHVMKQTVIVQDDGSFDYSKPDRFVQTAKSLGLAVHGHTLIWHKANNGDYLRSLVSGGSGSGAGPNLAKNGGFETWSNSVPAGWKFLNETNGSFSKADKSSNVHGGNYALEVTVTSTSDAWKTQIESPEFKTVAGHTYKVTFWIKASQGGCKYQLEGRSGSVKYSGTKDTPTSYSLKSFTFEGNGSASTIAFDMGASAGGCTTWIDDVKIKDTSKDTNGGGATQIQDSAAVANFMKKYITETVSRYKDEVKVWDVVNEPLADGTGKIRTNKTGAPTEGGIFYWGQYVGPEYIGLAFKYANLADPNAKLFINEYNLESDLTKLNSLIKLVEKLKDKGIPIDGIGTEMHISLNTSYAGISRAFKKLASTGLLIRVSELDVRINPNNRPGFEPTHQTISYQRVMYNYVVWAYMEYVPKDQRAGITVWNLTDKYSWIVDQGHNDYPTLFDKNFNKKPAFSGMMRGLKGYAPNEQ